MTDFFQEEFFEEESADLERKMKAILEIIWKKLFQATERNRVQNIPKDMETGNLCSNFGEHSL